ncbi:uncharacterized protein G2W53_015586 [Senna tora]|uniref:Uncharacterized protein n=1 Tax=Senna tora TaxID=362788 RepID=A0A834WVR5_9FABA|nr:uncharacterized protein G2W53_015586 [Senna tora]
MAKNSSNVKDEKPWGLSWSR